MQASILSQPRLFPVILPPARLPPPLPAKTDSKPKLPRRQPARQNAYPSSRLFFAAALLIQFMIFCRRFDKRGKQRVRLKRP